MVNAEILNLNSSEGALAVLGGSRPLQVNQRTGQVQIMTSRGIVVNSLLMRDEWAEVDRAVIDAARPLLRAETDLRSRGLRHPLGSMASVASRWYTASEVTAANINMTGQGGANRDLPEMIENGVPVPIIFKDFVIDIRSLMASRRMGDGLDMTALRAVTAVVAEAKEGMLVNGAGLRLNGLPVYGYRNHPNRNTATAGSLGGGDWGTIANILPTVSGMIAMAHTDNHYGPYVLYASTNQYNEAANSYYSDGSGDTPRDRILKLPQISAFEMLPTLADGELLLVQMASDVVDFAEPNDVPGIQVREWASGDGLTTNFKVMAVYVPRVKARQDGKSGVQHVTGA